MANGLEIMSYKNSWRNLGNSIVKRICVMGHNILQISEGLAWVKWVRLIVWFQRAEGEKLQGDIFSLI